VSVLLPAWNAAATLAAALASVQRQSLRDWECIVVDDGSVDGTADVAASAARFDARIRLVRIAHAGLVHALNVGLEHCCAPLVARMDADDLMHRRRLQRQAEALAADPGLAAIGCHVRIFPRRPMTPRRREYEAWLNGLTTAEDVRRDAFVECPVAHPSLMMRRDMADLGYYDRGWPEDYDLVLRALGAGLRIGVLGQRLLAWRDRPDGLCRTNAAYEVERFTACKAYYVAHGYLAQTPSYVLWGYGNTGRLLRRALAAHGKTPSHIVEVKPSRLGQRIHGAPVIAVSHLAALRGRPIVVSVARAGPRQEIRRALFAMGFREGSDYVCAA
jgi:glycosyltransferase involved in cell wall biosynthesis